jgi:hypothetical protein
MRRDWRRPSSTIPGRGRHWGCISTGPGGTTACWADSSSQTAWYHSSRRACRPGTGFAYVNNNPVRYSDPAGHDVGCAGRDAPACERDVPLWKRSAASLEIRAKRELLVGNRDNRINETILSSESPISRGIYFEWAAGNVIKSALSGGENLGQAATDLALIGSNNLSTGLLGLAMGGDVQPYQIGSYSNLNSLSSVGDPSRSTKPPCKLPKRTSNSLTRFRALCR